MPRGLERETGGEDAAAMLMRGGGGCGKMEKFVDSRGKEREGKKKEVLTAV